MNLRLALAADIQKIMMLVDEVVPLMIAAGNRQWDNRYPNAEVFSRDVSMRQLWVAEIEGSIAGVAAITTDQDAGYADAGWDITETAIVTHRLAVSPHYQGKGVAKALLLQAENTALERGIRYLRIDTNSENRVTQKLFPQLGYVFAGEIELQFRPGLRFYCYEKQL